MPPASGRLGHTWHWKSSLIVARYLLVDDTDGRVLAELASPQQAIRLLGHLARQPNEGPPVSVVKIDHQESSLTEVTSMVSVRPLATPTGRPKTTPSRDGRTARRSSPGPRLPLN
jgi:hypothetical protein